MDGDSNPYGQHGWNHDHSHGAPEDANEDLSDITFTGSQTQAIASIIQEDPTLFISTHPIGDMQMDHALFNDHTSGFESYQPEQHFHNGDSCHQQLFQADHCQSGQVTTAPPTSSSLHGVPAMDNWAGEFNYTVEFSKAQDKTKATPWVYSTKLEKLFVSLDKACPISFKVNIHPSYFPQYQIRGQVVYSRPEDYQEVVERCINHQNKDPAVLTHAAHLLRCDDVDAKYCVHDNKRHSVVVPLKLPAPGTQSVTLCFRFMCLSSCIGTLNRRPTVLIFTLERLDGVEMGRYACPVRICSCPGRDVRSEEEKISDEAANHSGKVEGPLGNQSLIPIPFPPPGCFKPGKIKKRKTSPSMHQPSAPTTDGEVFNLNVNIRGRMEYEAIRSVVENMVQVFEAHRASNSGGNHSNSTAEPKRFKEEP